LKKNIDIEVSGHKFTIRSNAEEDYVCKVAEYLNKKIEEVFQTTKTVDTINVVILAAMNIADDFFCIKNEHGELQQCIEDRSGRLISFIDSQVDNEERYLS